MPMTLNCFQFKAKYAFLLHVFALLIFSNLPAAAQTCRTDYAVRRGDTLTAIATRVYGDASQWGLIFYANQDRLGTTRSLLEPGLVLKIPCIGAPQGQRSPEAATTRAPAAAPKPSPNQFVPSSLLKRVALLTAEGYAPLTGRDLPNGGMITEIVSASMELIKAEAKGAFDYDISWVNDWAAHLNPLLTSHAFDAGFPWEKPDCDDEEDEEDEEAQSRCKTFFYSDPLYEIFEVLFISKNASSKFETDSEVIGKKICLTVDNDLDDVDGGGRNWAKDGKVTLSRPASLQDCFRQLQKQSVDAVVASEMTGIVTAATLGMADKVMVAPRPIKTQTVHVIVPKNHPQARTLLYNVNAALAKLKESGDYDRIMKKHLSNFWATYDPQQAMKGTAPAKKEAPTAAPAARPEQNGTRKSPPTASEPQTSRAQR